MNSRVQSDYVGVKKPIIIFKTLEFCIKSESSNAPVRFTVINCVGSSKSGEKSKFHRNRFHPEVWSLLTLPPICHRHDSLLKSKNHQKYTQILILSNKHRFKPEVALGRISNPTKKILISEKSSSRKNH